jgi:hypothetical protein
MTSLIAWIGVDSRGPSSAYIASDSRLSWPAGCTWDHGRKLFASRLYPHVLGYCGDVLFPSQTLSQVAELIDARALFAPTDGVDVCVDRVVSVIDRAFQTYPLAARKPFEVLYCLRQGDAVPSLLHVRSISFDSTGSSRVAAIELPAHSDVICVLGSGAPAVRESLAAWQSSDVGGTSRAAFAAFCDSLRNGSDPLSGGPPQLVGLWRRGPANAFGIVWHGRPYLYGTEVDVPSTGCIHWYNELFEECDARTLARREGAQPQPRPRLLRATRVSEGGAVLAD